MYNNKSSITLHLPQRLTTSQQESLVIQKINKLYEAKKIKKESMDAYVQARHEHKSALLAAKTVFNVVLKWPKRFN